jgi:uncharacterized protein YndB with AHSA1/START domain
MASTAEGIAVVREVLISAPPETIWPFLVDAEKAVRWMGVAASLEPRPGGRYRVEVLPGKVVLGEFIEVDPPRRLVHTWGWADGAGSVPPGSTTVAFDLIVRDEGTLVRVTHGRLPQAAAASSHGRGWDHYLPRLEAIATEVDPGIDPWIERPEL